MTDAMFRQVLANLADEMREGREVAQSLARNLSIVSGTCMRIEQQIKNLSDRLAELRDDHDRVCVEIAQTDRAIAKRISQIEKQAAWVRAWAAGAAAAVVGVFGAVAWIAAKMPGLLTVVGGK